MVLTGSHDVLLYKTAARLSESGPGYLIVHRLQRLCETELASPRRHYACRHVT